MGRSRLLREIHDWIGTPFHHQARRKGVGCDCIGLIIGVATALGIKVDDYRAYPVIGDPVMLIKKLREHADEVSPEQMKPGDIIVFKLQKRPVHAAFYVGDGIVHTYYSARKVVKHDLSPKWANRIYKVFRMRQLDD